MINPLDNPLVQISSQHCQSQTGRTRELKFWENVHPTVYVMCHVSGVRFHLWSVKCHLSHVKIFFFTLKKYWFFFGHKQNLTKWWSWSVEGLLSTGPNPSSFFSISNNQGNLKPKMLNINHRTLKIHFTFYTCKQRQSIALAKSSKDFLNIG